MKIKYMQIGDIVKAVSGTEGIFQGQEISDSYCWAIQQTDGSRHGGAQNGWWSCSKNSTLEKLDKALSIHCPTQEEYNMVVKKLLDGGREWLNNSKEIHSERWEKYKEKTGISINWIGNGEITYSKISNECSRPIVETTAKEFLGEYPTAIYKEDNKPKKNIMSKIKSFVKNLTLSADDKLLREYGFQNECGDYTESAEELVISKLVADNKDYIIEIAKKMKEEDDKE